MTAAIIRELQAVNMGLLAVEALAQRDTMEPMLL
jgi:hypothetical protein